MRILSHFLLMCIPLLTMAQQQTICLHTENGMHCAVVQDSIERYRFQRNWLMSMQAEAYLSAGIDSSSYRGDTVHLWAYQGAQFSTLKFSKHNLPQQFLDSSIRTMDYTDFSQLTEKVIDHFENAGYPFASVQVKNPRIVAGGVAAELFFDKGIEIRYDSLVVLGSSKLSKRYLARYLDVQQGERYQESVLKTVDKKLRNLPLVNLKEATKLYFYRGLARLVLHIDERVTDRLDGVVGLAPNSTNSSENKLLVTGEIHIELNNILRSAKQASLHWRNYLERSQALDLSFTLPYLFNTKMGLNTTFDLNKLDTFFVNLNANIGVRYQQQGNNYLELYYQYNGSNLISADTTAIRQSKRLPDNNPYRIDNYGIRLFQRDFDYLPNPRKGYEVLIDGAVGLKRLLRNTEIDQVLFSSPNFPEPISIYDTIDRQNLRARFSVELKHHLPIGKHSTLLNELSFHGLFAPHILFNEYYNFGGYHSLQGFDERSLFASKYIQYHIAYRYLFSRNGNIGLFFNAAAIENTIQYHTGHWIQDLPIGFGISTHLAVGSGVLRIAYAMGRQQGNALQLSSAKIHFGLVNYF